MTLRRRLDGGAVWAVTGLASLCLAAILGVCGYVLVRGLGAFWPAPVVELSLRDGSVHLGEVVAWDDGFLVLRESETERVGAHYRRVARGDIAREARPDDAVSLQGADGRRLFVRGGEDPAPAVVVESLRPNALSTLDRVGVTLARAARFVTGGATGSPWVGGMLPAIAGTLLLVVLMALFVVPLGTATAAFLHLRKGRAARLVRGAVATLASVPSIVYGVIGLGLFVHGFGRALDQWFHAAQQPVPVFGSGGLLWAALTLALLTLPVFVTSVDQGLSRLPRSLEAGSLALGATREQTLRMLLLPAAWPAMLTGLMLAVARACGAVAPLMLVGVVELAPALPLDGEFPYLHPSRQFMHLGHAVYDAAMANPDPFRGVSRAFAAAALLLAVVLVLNFVAMVLRDRLRERYRALDD